MCAGQCFSCLAPEEQVNPKAPKMLTRLMLKHFIHLLRYHVLTLKIYQNIHRVGNSDGLYYITVTIGGTVLDSGSMSCSISEASETDNMMN